MATYECETIKTIRVELKPTKEQYKKMKRFAGCVNKVYNTLLAEWIDYYNNKIMPIYKTWNDYEKYQDAIKQLNFEKSKKVDALTKTEINKLEEKKNTLKKYFEKNIKPKAKPAWDMFEFSKVTKLKQNLPYLKECDSQALANAHKNLTTAFKKYFDGKAKFPKFHSKKKNRSFKTCVPSKTALDFVSHRLKYPKIGAIEIKNKKPPKWYKNLKSHPKNITITILPNGRVFASIVFCEVIEERICKSNVADINENQVIGLDFDLHDFFITSNGQSAKNDFGWIPQKQSSKKLPHLQRKLARTKCLKTYKNSNGKTVNIYSKRHYKLVKRVANEEWRIANRRRDFLEKIALYLVQNYKVIGIEDLNIAGMKKVTQKVSLEDGSVKKTRIPHSNSRNYEDIAWSTFVELLERKSNLYGCRVIKIGKFYPSSQECSNCHEINKEVATKHLESWICPKCGAYHASRDINAAINIKQEALKILREA